MDKELLERWWWQADPVPGDGIDADDLARFAARVAEECAKIAEGDDLRHPDSVIQREIAGLIRERFQLTAT